MRHLELPASNEWVTQAACRGTPIDWWFPERGDTITHQRAVCATCPVVDACLADALLQTRYEATGILGGTSAQQRRRMRGQSLTMVHTPCRGIGCDTILDIHIRNYAHDHRTVRLCPPCQLGRREEQRRIWRHRRALRATSK